jgi:rod shape-determining protein MreD
MSNGLSMLIFSFIVFSLFLFVLQTTLFAELPAWLGRPDLIFLLVVFLAYRFEAIKGAVLVFLIGLLMDIFSGIFLGIYPTVYLLVFFILKILSKHMANEATFQAPLALLSYLFTASCIFVISSLLAPEAHLEWSWRIMLLQVIMLAVVAIPFFSLCDLYMTFCSNKVVKWRPFKLRDSGNRFKS